VTTSGSVRPRHGLLDTSAVIALPSLTDADRLPQEPLISAITLAELSVGPLLARDPDERMRRQAHVQQAEADFLPIPFDAAAARAFARVASDLRSSGRKPAARALDALIAAVALSRDLPVYTANPHDFLGITGLTVKAL
jgi:tRNA(fMet)-specific endonuclease VapC